MAKAVQTYTGYTIDYTSQIRYAVSESGKVFERTQYRDPVYGYKWRPWRETSPSVIDGKTPDGPRNYRLPA